MVDPEHLLRAQTEADLQGGPDLDTHISLDPADLPAALEAVLFAAGDPLSLERIQQITGVERQELQRLLGALGDRYARDHQRGLLLREIEGRYFLCTKPAMKTVLARLFQPRQRPPLSQAAYETLAIIAYNQPVTRAQVEAVRGVNSDSIIGRLIERNLIREVGNLEAPGRPLLFATTDQFLLDFGLRSVRDLPPMELLMYGTLRDFEHALDEAAGRTRDRQITIDQIVQAFVPGDQEPEPLPVQTDAAGTAAEAMPDETVLQVSEALFGEDEKALPDPERDSF
jgi:segregation and condensation protein B